MKKTGLIFVVLGMIASAATWADETSKTSAPQRLGEIAKYQGIVANVLRNASVQTNADQTELKAQLRDAADAADEASKYALEIQAQPYKVNAGVKKYQYYLLVTEKVKASIQKTSSAIDAGLQALGTSQTFGQTLLSELQKAQAEFSTELNYFDVLLRDCLNNDPSRESCIALWR